ncbi:MAG: hypothetical protein IJH39_05135 [Clostridia bacterium]|nr:hypothetical protein [Clostridia bacterium]
MFTKAERSTFPYWFAHACAFNMTALNCRVWKLKYLFHDIEKPWLKLFLPYKKVQEIHRKNNRHHPEWLENKLAKYYWETPYDVQYEVDNFLKKFDYEGAILDWECCHFTKSEEPLNAHDEYKRLLSYDKFKEKYPFITKYCYNDFSINLMNTIKRLGLENK